jgi:hypothetical protein
LRSYRQIAVFSVSTIAGDTCRGFEMAIVMLSALAGALCGLFRCRVIIIIPLTAAIVLVSVTNGLVVHTDTWLVVTEAIGSIAVLQATYASIGLALRRLRSQPDLPFIQATIGRELRAELEIPRNLPPYLSTLVARLQAA